MIYSHEVEMMCPVAQVQITDQLQSRKAKWVQAKEIKDIPDLHTV